jgi:hypothetical protein
MGLFSAGRTAADAAKTAVISEGYNEAGIRPPIYDIFIGFLRPAWVKPRLYALLKPATGLGIDAAVSSLARI